MTLRMRIGAIAGALALFSGPAAATAGGQSSDAAADAAFVRAEIARLGYVTPIRDGEAWSDELQFAFNRLMRRLDRAAPAALDAREAARRLREAPLPAAVPCPSIKAASGAVTPVEVTFQGDRPDAYLATFYRRLAECRPEALAPEPATEKPLAVNSLETAGEGPLPIRRSRTVIDEYRAAERALRASGLAGPFAAPGVTANVTRAVRRKTVMNKIEAKSGDGTPSYVARSGRTPRRSEIARLCGDLGYAASCADTALFTTVETPSIDGVAYWIVDVPHFELTVRLTLPKADAEGVLSDAIDAALAAYGALDFGPKGAWPRIYWPEAEVEPLADSVRVCTPLAPDAAGARFACGEATPERIVDLKRQSDSVAALVGWRADDPQLQMLETVGKSSSVLVMEPGFDHLTSDDYDSGQRQHTGADGPKAVLQGRLDHVTALRAVAESPTLYDGARYPDDQASNGIGARTWRLGHALHVSNIIAGGGRKNAIGVGVNGLASDSGKSPGTFSEFLMSHSKWRELLKANADKPLVEMPPHEFFSNGDAIVVNRSFQHSEAAQRCPVSPGPMDVVLNIDQSEAPVPPRYMTFGRGSTAVQTPPSNIFDVVAAPTECPSQSPFTCKLNFTDSCFGSYARGVTVAALKHIEAPKGAAANSNLWKKIEGAGASQSRYWTVMTEEPDPGGASYRLDEGLVAYLAAPGENIWSVDAVITDLSKQQVGYGVAPRSGSSMAAPMVAALAARVKHDYPGMRWGELKRWLLATSTPLYMPPDIALKDLYEGNKNENIIGIVNFYRAIKMNYDSVGAWGNPGDCTKKGQPTMLGEHSTCLLSGDRVLLHPALAGSFHEMKEGTPNEGWRLPLAVRRNPHTNDWRILWSVGVPCMNPKNLPPRCETFETTTLCLEADDAKGCNTKPDCDVNARDPNKPYDACIAIELPNRGGERGIDLTIATQIIGIGPGRWFNQQPEQSTRNRQ
jgi:hypothetical protein